MTAAAETRRRARAGPLPDGWTAFWSAPAALRAVRATVVVTGIFAFAHQVIGNLQTATFAAFGGFATLVLVSFAGTRRDKLLAHVGLALAGSALLTIGTAVSHSTVLAGIVTVPVAFAVFFAGVAGPNAAAAVPGALLAYVLPAASPGGIGTVPDRLAGWWLASVAGTVAVLVLSPRPGDDRLRAAASRLASALAAELESALAGTARSDDVHALIAGKHELAARFTETPYRPTGLTAPDQALANDVEMLEWCTSLVADALRERADLREAAPADRQLIAAAASALRDVGSLLSGGDMQPDLDALRRLRDESAARLASPDGAAVRAQAQLSFHAHAIADAVLAAGANALVTSRLAEPDWVDSRRERWFVDSSARRRAGQVAAVARRDASLRSVWFVNSARGAIALAAAVAVAHATGVQHGFWVVLGTLSVLRTNATSTGATALRALAGTAVGFVVGGALLLAIGSSSGLLWAVLPVAVLFAAYTPGTAPFAVGQAAFTVTVAVLFNLLVPVGWKVGVIRIEDVALGCVVSVVVGALFWPRGAASVVGNDLADAFRSGAEYLSQAVEWACGRRAAEPEGAMVTVTAGERLDDALRAFLAEQGSKRIDKRELWRLVGGSMRLRLTAHAIAATPPAHGRSPDRAHDALIQRTETLSRWYGDLADLVGRPRPASAVPLEPPELAPAVASGSHSVIWLSEHLDHLLEHIAELVRPADHIAEIRRLPWWR